MLIEENTHGNGPYSNMMSVAKIMDMKFLKYTYVYIKVI